MTTIIRTDVTLSNPKSGALVLPSLGISSGPKHRWHADAISGEIGSLVTEIPDSIGTTHLKAVEGKSYLRSDAKGRRYIDLNGAAVNSLSATTADRFADYTLVALYHWDVVTPAATNIFSPVAAGSTNGGMNLLGGKNGIGTWTGDGGKVVSTTVLAYLGWHVLIIGYSATGDEIVTADGQAVSRTNAGGNLSTMSTYAVKGNSAYNSKVRDLMIFDRVLSNSDIEALWSTMKNQMPV